jgi:hypothetical protein
MNPQKPESLHKVGGCTCSKARKKVGLEFLEAVSF